MKLRKAYETADGNYLNGVRAASSESLIYSVTVGNNSDAREWVRKCIIFVPSKALFSVKN